MSARHRTGWRAGYDIPSETRTKVRVPDSGALGLALTMVGAVIPAMIFFGTAALGVATGLAPLEA